MRPKFESILRGAKLLGWLRMAAPALIFCLGIVATMLIWDVSQQQAREKTSAAFTFEVTKFAEALESHLKATSQVLRGVVGLYATADAVDGAVFQRYVSVLRLDDRYPGIQGIGYAPLVSPGEVDAVVREARAEGVPGFVIQPGGGREVYAPIMRLEPPDWLNQRALGFDMYAEPVRREAMQRARDSGLAALSGKVPLQAEGAPEAQVGCLLYVPVYRGGEIPATVEARRAALRGWVFVVLRIHALVGGVLARDFPELGGRIGLEIHDGERPEAESLMFRSEAHVSAFPGAQQVDLGVRLAGHPWVVRGYALQPDDTAMNGGHGRRFLVLGTLSSILLASLAAFVLNSYARAAKALEQTAWAHRLLSENQTELQAIYDTSGVAIFLLDSEGKLARVNQRMAEMFGATPAMLTGCSYASLLPEDEPPALELRAADQEPSQDTVLSLERRYLRRDGREFWGFLSGRRLLDRDGRNRGMVGVIVDISDRRDAEKRLQRSEARYRTLAETIQDVVWTLDVQNLRYLYCSASVERLRGYTPEEVIGAPLGHSLTPASMKRIGPLLRERADAFASGAEQPDRYYVDELDQLCRDGSVVATEVVSSYFRDEDSGAICLRGVTRNISERRRSEALLRIAAAAFESRESMVVTDADGQVVRVNRAFTALTGYTPEEVFGRSLRILHSGRHDHEFYVQMWQVILRDGFWQGQVWNRRKDGQILPVMLTITAVKDAVGQTTHYIGSALDITRQVERESEISNLAFYDPLTGLANRRLLMDRLAHAFAKSARSRRYGAVIFLDLDRFKAVNDQLGHGEGDRLLELVADRLTANVRDGDTVARLGGDEFVVLLEDVATAPDLAGEIAMGVAEKLRQALDVPYKLYGGEAQNDWKCSPSMGVALFLDHDESVPEVLARADRALYQAKENGRDAICLDRSGGAPTPAGGAENG